MDILQYTWEQSVLNLSPEGIGGCLRFFLLAGLIFWPLEIFFRAQKQPLIRREWFIDLSFFLGQFLVFNGLSVACLLVLSHAFQSANFFHFHEQIAQLPYAVQVFAIISLCDLSIYWAHRLSHRWAFLWRFHRVHHTAERLDWLAAYREHPLDNIYTRVVENLPALLLGFPMETIAGFVFFRGLWGLFIHSNVNITLGPLTYLIGAPRLHHWHHDVKRGGNCNFANLSPLMDLIFGTYYDPGREPCEYGITEETPRSYWGQLIQPLTPRRLWKRWSAPISKVSVEERGVTCSETDQGSTTEQSITEPSIAESSAAEPSVAKPSSSHLIP